MRKIFAVFLFCLLVTLGLFLYIKIDSSRIKNFQVIFFNVGQGDSALINFDNGEKMLVDCGPDRKILSKLGSALPFYDKTIDYLLVTHPDKDHYGGCVDVLKKYHVKNIITNGEEKSADNFWQVWNEYVKKEQAELTTLAEEEKWTIGQAEILFLFADDSNDTDTGNENSLVFRLSYNQDSILFTGDISVAKEEELVKQYCSAEETVCPALFSKYLKTAHHGSDTSSADVFLQAINPQISIISVGKNSFGHPSLRVLKKMLRIGAEVWRTDEKGDIILSAKNGELFSEE